MTDVLRLIQMRQKTHAATADCCGVKKLELFLFFASPHLSAATACRFAANGPLRGREVNYQAKKRDNLSRYNQSLSLNVYEENSYLKPT